ncbi:MAG TPA: hypothetical protein VMT72_04095 [Pseudolabrys sp.]|nr:hypothetical protein [Pseudolabrys sp.]
MRQFSALGLASIALLLGNFASSAQSGAPPVTVAYQPMVSTGLAAKQPFEAWLVFDKSPDPAVAGYSVPAGATVRLTFPKEFTPQAGNPHLEGALLHGWPHGAIPVPFSVMQDKTDPRVVVIRIDQAIASGPPERPGLKAIHVRTGELNPNSPGDYPISVQFIDAGPLSGTTSAIAHITDKPVPNVAAYNQLHQSKDEDWQHVKPGMEAPLPIDFLVTLPDEARSTISLTSAGDGALSILSDGKPIGSVRSQGVPVTLTPESFGPGYARLGIMRVRAKAGSQPGTAEIIAALESGTQYKITVIVD